MKISPAKIATRIAQDSKPGRKKAAALAPGGKPAPLEKYREKRDFKKTPEPGPKVPRRGGNSFVIQEHHARAHHFDLRLEIDGVLVSWAVPKGIPEDLVAKRLAVHVEDHPLEYGKFEGTIPQGNYGAGTVSIWDKGQWEPMDPENWRKDFEKGTLKFHLKGDRLNSPYLLARMNEEPNWMLKLLNPATHPLPTAKPNREIAGFISPQLARVVPSVPGGGDWIHEIKFDGYRLIAVQRGGVVTLFTRSGLDWTDRFQATAKHLAGVTGSDFVIDGEAVVFDEKGRSNFGDLQAALQSRRSGDITFMAFDLLHFDGLNLRDLPLSERTSKLAELLSEEPGPVRRSKVWPAAMGRDLFKQAAAAGLEGIISKNAKGRYIGGSRRDWTKSKARPRQEFVICGYTPPKGSLPAFGALVLASYENGKLIPRGRVGTGFSDKSREQLLRIFKPLRTKAAPFPSVDKEVEWLKPQLVAEIEFAEITRDGSIRHGSFVALREDEGLVYHTSASSSEYRTNHFGGPAATGFAGSCAGFAWATGGAALLLAPLLVLVVVWLYTVIFVFAACWFTHYGLAELQQLRDAEHTHLQSELFSESPTP